MPLKSVHGTQEWHDVLNQLVYAYGPGPKGAELTPYLCLYGGLKLAKWWMVFVPAKHRRYEPKIECGRAFTVEHGGYIIRCVSGQGIRDIYRDDN